MESIKLTREDTHMTSHPLPAFISAAFPHKSLPSVCIHIHADNPDNGCVTVIVALTRSLCLCLADKTALKNHNNQDSYSKPGSPTCQLTVDRPE